MIRLGQMAPLALGLMSPGCFEKERVLDEDAWLTHEAEMQVELDEVVDIWKERCEEAQGVIEAVCSSESIREYDSFECEKLKVAIDATFREEMKLFERFFDNNGCSVDWNIEKCDAMNGRLEFKNDGVGGRTISSWSDLSPSVTCSSIPFRR